MQTGRETANPEQIYMAVGVVLALTVLVSAYLLFQVQPLISKFILPWFGGSPAVWTTAMLFFQCLLFFGYSYAHLVSRFLSIRQQTLIHIALVISAAYLAAFIVPDEHFKPTGTESPVWQILLLLGSCVGVPYFCLATTGPLIQYWFSHAYPGRSPYRLYSLSNVGSFLALLSFPYLFEPFFELSQLGSYWTIGFWIFASFCIAAALQMLQRSSSSSSADHYTSFPAESIRSDSLGKWQRVGWIALPALASLAFIATTDRISHDIAPEPRLWITTLSLYLLTFIICFDQERWYQRRPTAIMCLLTILILTGSQDIAEWLGFDWYPGVTEVRWSHFLAMFLICFMCHGELVRLRPKSHDHLTEFYLWMSFGGACGGIFVTLVATNLFDGFYSNGHLFPGVAHVSGAYIYVSARTSEPSTVPNKSTARVNQLFFGAARGCSVPGIGCLWLNPFQWQPHFSPEFEEIYLHNSRNFYGTVAVEDQDTPDSRPKSCASLLAAGYRSRCSVYSHCQAHAASRVLLHGEWGRGDGGISKIKYTELELGRHRLGYCTLATCARESDHYDYEINPKVIQIANQWFDNVPRCKARTKEMILGDARLKLEQAADDVQYDIIALDAFSGDSVPVHLLTREAFAILHRHLKPNGFIVIHITNRYLNLYPVVKRQAEHLGMGFRNKFQGGEPSRLVFKNHYFIITDNAEYLSLFPSVNRRYLDDEGNLIGEDDPNIPNVPLWTDHFSSINPIEIRN